MEIVAIKFSSENGLENKKEDRARSVFYNYQLSFNFLKLIKAYFAASKPALRALILASTIA